MKYLLKTIIGLLSITNFLFAISFAKTYGGGNLDYAFSIQQTNDSGYVVAGWTGSFGAGYIDFLVIKLSSTGSIEWAKTFGGPNYEYSYSIQQTNDGGYIVAGVTNSFVGGSYDFLVIKISPTGDLQWAKTFGGINNDYGRFVQQTNDGGYIVGGYTESFGAGIRDFLIIKLNSEGGIQWAKTFGGGNSEHASSIQQTNDGGYIVAGFTESFGAGPRDFLVIKLSSTGDIQWAKTFGGTDSDSPLSIRQTNDDGYIVAGWTYSLGAGGHDILVIKLTSTGDIEWAKTFGGGDADIPSSIQQTNDGGYIVAGYTVSFGVGGYDFLIIKLTSTGDIEWAKTFGGVNHDETRSIQQTNDGGYVIAGYTESFGVGNKDFLIIKTQDGQMASDCPWYDQNPLITSPNILTSFPSLTSTSPNLTTLSPSFTVSSPTLSTNNVCSVIMEENTYFLKENVKLISSIFLKDKISLKFSGYSNEKIKIILYDVLGNEIISKTFQFNNYIEIKEEKIKKLQKGIYFLKIYLNEKEIGEFKLIKKD